MKKILGFVKKKRGLSPSPSKPRSALPSGYEINEKDLRKLHRAASRGNLPVIRQLLRKHDINELDRENRTPLHLACANGHTDAVTLLVEKNSKLNLCDNEQRSPLIKAVQCQQVQCASILLEHEADPNIVDIDGNTALHYAVLVPSKSTAFQLLEHGACLDTKNSDGCTPLILAVPENHKEIVEFLIDEGANVNAEDNQGRTPLMIAASNGHIGLVKMLLQHDVNVFKKDQTGWTADDHAAMNGHHACSHLIIEYSSQKRSKRSAPFCDSSNMTGASKLNSPSRVEECGFALGGPASDKEVTEDLSQESGSCVSGKSGDEEFWPSDDDDLDFGPQTSSKTKPSLKQLLHTQNNVNENSSTTAQPIVFPQHSESNIDEDSVHNNAKEELVNHSLPKSHSQVHAFPHPMYFEPDYFAKVSQMTSPLLSLNKDEESLDETDGKDGDSDKGSEFGEDFPSPSFKSHHYAQQILQDFGKPDGRKALMSELGLEDDDIESPWDSESASESPIKHPGSPLHSQAASPQMLCISEASNEEFSAKSTVLEVNQLKSIQDVSQGKAPSVSLIKEEGGNIKTDLPQNPVSETTPPKDVTTKHPATECSTPEEENDLSHWDSTSCSSKDISCDQLPADLPQNPVSETIPPKDVTTNPPATKCPTPEAESDLSYWDSTSSSKAMPCDRLPTDSSNKSILAEVEPNMKVDDKEKEKNVDNQLEVNEMDGGDSKLSLQITGLTAIQTNLNMEENLQSKHDPLKGKPHSNKRNVTRAAGDTFSKQQSTSENEKLTEVFADSTLSKASEGGYRRLLGKATKGKDKKKNDNDLDDFISSTDTSTEDYDSPSSTFKNALLLIEQINIEGKDSLNLLKFRNIIQEYENLLQNETGQCKLLAKRVKKLENEKRSLHQIKEGNKELKSILEHQKMEWENELSSSRYSLKQEEEKRKSAEMLYDKCKSQLRKKEAQCCIELEEKNQLQLTLRNLELELRSLRSNVKQVEEERNEAQSLFSQERNARVLQEGVINNMKMKNDMKENQKLLAKSAECLTQPSEEKDLAQKNAALQAEMNAVKQNLDQVQTSSQEKEIRYIEEIEILREKVDDLRRDLKMNEETLTQTVIQYNGQLNALKTEAAMLSSKLDHENQSKERLETELESIRSRLNSTSQELDKNQTLKADAERSLQRERDVRLRSQDKLNHELSSMHEKNSSLSQQLSKIEAKSNGLDCELHKTLISLQEKTLLLENTQRDLVQSDAKIKDLEHILQNHKEELSKSAVKQDSMQERLAQSVSENLLLRQQLEEAQNKSVFNEKSVCDVQDKFTDMYNKLRADTERQIQIVEERNKDLINKSNELREKLYKFESGTVERESTLRQLQQELADALKKLSMSEASLDVITRYRNGLEEEKQYLQEEVKKLNSKLQDLNAELVQSEKCNNQLKNMLEYKDREVIATSDKVKELSSTAADTEKAIKQFEEHIQRLEIENANFESNAKQQTRQIDSLNKELQDTLLSRSRLEDLVTTLQSSKISLEEKLNQQVYQHTAVTQHAQDSHNLWEEELKSRSRLGICLAELNSEKIDLKEQVESEKKKVKKLIEHKEAMESRFEEELKRSNDIQRENSGLRKLLKTVKKKLRDYETGKVHQDSFHNESENKYLETKSEVARLKEKVGELSLHLEGESTTYMQLESANRDLKEQLSSMKTLQRSHDRLEEHRRQLEEEVAELKRHVESTKIDQACLEHYKREIEEKGRKDLCQKLEEVNIFLQTQAASHETIEQMRAANNISVQNQTEQRIQDLERELVQFKSTQQDISHKESIQADLERFKNLYAEEIKIRKSLSAKLDRTKENLSETNAKLLSERKRSKSLIIGNFGNESHSACPVLETYHMGNISSNISMDRSFGQGGSHLSLSANGVSTSKVESYLEQMRQELDRSITRHLNQGNADVDIGSTRVSPVGSTANSLRNLNTDQDPVYRATQEYLEVLKKNYMM